jgi:hypothetical protein
MEYSQHLSPVQWVKLYEYLRAFPRIHTRNEGPCHRFVEAVFWV